MSIHLFSIDYGLSTWTFVLIHSVDKPSGRRLEPVWMCRKQVDKIVLSIKLYRGWLSTPLPPFLDPNRTLCFWGIEFLWLLKLTFSLLLHPPFCHERFLLCGTYQCIFYIHSFERLISCIRHWRRRAWLVMYCSLYSRDQKYDSCMNAIFICWNVLISCVVVSCHQQPACSSSYKLSFSFIVVLWNILHKL